MRVMKQKCTVLLSHAMCLSAAVKQGKRNVRLSVWCLQNVVVSSSEAGEEEREAYCVVPAGAAVGRGPCSMVVMKQK